MASYKRLQEVGEYNTTREFLINGKLYRVVLLYGRFEVYCAGGYLEPEPIAQCFILEDSELVGMGMRLIGGKPEDIPDSLEEVLHQAMVEAGLNLENRKSIGHWMLGENCYVAEE